jgi:hypothetical protein
LPLRKSKFSNDLRKSRALSFSGAGFSLRCSFTVSGCC